MFLCRGTSPVCHEQGRVFHNCCLVFAPKAKVGGSRGRVLWWAVDTGCYLWGAEIAAIFSSMLGPCTVVFVISSQLSTPPALLRDEEELAPWHGEEVPGVFLPGEVLQNRSHPCWTSSEGGSHSPIRSNLGFVPGLAGGFIPGPPGTGHGGFHIPGVQPRWLAAGGEAELLCPSCGAVLLPLPQSLKSHRYQQA